MNDSFDGIHEKLKRTRENIGDLESEISAFFQGGEYPVLPEDDRELLLKAIQYHKSRVIPLRFSVLVGEIVHHLRSCLDHVIWEFSDETYRLKYFWKIEFPVVEVRPSDKDSKARYEGKIKGITGARLREFIEKLQPYNTPDPIECPLLILHKMDVIDKHRELVLCTGTGVRELPMGVIVEKALASYQHSVSSDEIAKIAFELKGYGKLIPQVSFSEFGGREVQPVVPGLIELNNYVVNVLRQFDV